VTWPVVALGEVAETTLGKMLDKGRTKGLPHVPYLRNVNVQWGRIDTDDLLTMELADGDRERFAVREGDLLACEGGEIGRCAIWHGRADYLAFQKALHRIRTGGALDPRFLRYLLEHHSQTGTLARFATGSTIAHLPQQQLRRVPVPLPPVHEQRRIVDLLEDHLSRLDAAADYESAALLRAKSLREQLVVRCVTGHDVPGERTHVALDDAGTHDGALASLPTGWAWRRLGEVADVVGGVTKDSKKQSDSRFVEVPYLRVANVQRGSLRLDDVATIRVAPHKAKALRLEAGDVLLNEGGDRDKLARGWVWQNEIDDCIHQNHVFRARVRPDLDPYFLSWTANSIGGRWAERNGKQSVNLASISLSMIRQMPVVLPPAGVSTVAVAQLNAQLEDTDRLARAVESSRSRAQQLRRAMLSAAFSGRLTGRPRIKK
jgi:type I restriction enzyme S subunit